MKRALLFLFALFCFKNLFSIDTTELVPSEVLFVAKGDENDEVSISIIGGSLFPNDFGVDSAGNFYIDDAYNRKRTGILLFSKEGEFVKRFSIKGQTQEISRLGIDENNHVYISNPTTILRIEEDGTFEEVLSTQHWTVEPNIRRFMIIGNDVVIKDANGSFKSVLEKEANPEERVEKIESFSESLGLLRDLEESDMHEIYFTKEGLYIAERIEIMRALQEKIEGAKLEIEEKNDNDFIPYEYDVAELRYFGIDREGNTYWCYMSRYQLYYSTIFVYNQEGKCLIKFNTNEKGDIEAYMNTPFVDYWGNIYSMQVWKDYGINIFKYQRQW